MTDENNIPETQESEGEEQIGLPILHLVVAAILGLAIILLLLTGGGEEAVEVEAPEVAGAEGKQVELDIDLSKTDQSPVDKKPVDSEAAAKSVGEAGKAEKGEGSVAPAPEEKQPERSPELTISDLESAEPGMYTLQLLAAYRESAVVSYIERYPDLPITYYMTLKDGFPWYVAVIGLYVSRDEAVAEVKKLPQDMVARNPWPKPVKQVKKELKEAK